MPGWVRLGLRGQLLVGLMVVTLLAVLTTGLLTLYVAQQSHAGYEEESAQALAHAAAGLLAASRDPQRSLRQDADRGRFGEAARRLARTGAFARLWVVDRDGRPVLSTMQGEDAGQPRVPPREAGLATALGGVERVVRLEGASTASEGTATQLRIFVPLRRGGAVEGVVVFTVAFEGSLSGAAARSRLLLLALGLLDGVVILLLGALLLDRVIMRPVTQLARVADRIARGERDLRVPEGGPGEVGELAGAFNRMTAALAGKVTQLEARTEELAQSRAHLVRAEKLASVGQLAAGLAHEVGNPLGAMLGYVEILAQTGTGDLKREEVQDLGRRLRRELERIHRLMQDLLAFARPTPEEVQPLDLGEVVMAAVELMQPQQRFRGVVLTTDVPGDLPPVSASAGRLTQVLVNLLLNAADAVGDDGEVRLTARAAEDHVVLEVRDNGPGVPPEHRERIFDPFFTTKEPGEGTGLGLSVSAALLETSGARLTLVTTDDEPDVGPGATFRVRLPRA